jgi:hypothetical protein
MLTRIARAVASFLDEISGGWRPPSGPAKVSPWAYSYRSATSGSTRVARRAGR